MRKYLEICKFFFKAQIAYRFDVLMTMVLMISKLLFAYILWGAIYSHNDTVASFTYIEMMTYYIISSFLAGIEMSDNVSHEISRHIRMGTFSKYMVLPLSPFGYFTAQTIGKLFFNLFFIFVTILLFGLSLGINLVVTNSLISLVLTIILILLGLIFMIQFNYFLGILAFKYLDINIFLMIKNDLLSFLTGTLIPLTLLPGVVLSVMRYIPFYYVTYLPSMALIGKNQNELLPGIIIILICVFFFMLINKVMYKKLRIKYDGVGI